MTYQPNEQTIIRERSSIRVAGMSVDIFDSCNFRPHPTLMLMLSSCCILKQSQQHMREKPHSVCEQTRVHHSIVSRISQHISIVHMKTSGAMCGNIIFPSSLSTNWTTSTGRSHPVLHATASTYGQHRVCTRKQQWPPPLSLTLFVFL